MTTDFAYDPVTAIEEAKAVGETAVLFAEFRQTMRIPLVTSIWRGLAGMDDGLRLAWGRCEPIYGSGEPECALTRSVAAVGLPRPEPLAPTALACVGLTESDIIAARAVIAAYNRSIVRPYWLPLNLTMLRDYSITVSFLALIIAKSMGAPMPGAVGACSSPSWSICSSCSNP